jgi:hypothetical protein
VRDSIVSVSIVRLPLNLELIFPLRIHSFAEIRHIDLSLHKQALKSRDLSRSPRNRLFSRFSRHLRDSYKFAVHKRSLLHNFIPARFQNKRETNTAHVEARKKTIRSEAYKSSRRATHPRNHAKAFTYTLGNETGTSSRRTFVVSSTRDIGSTPSTSSSPS